MSEASVFPAVAPIQSDYSGFAQYSPGGPNGQPTGPGAAFPPAASPQPVAVPQPGALASTFAVLIGALRLLARHWPTLFALIIAAFVAREGLIYVAVQVSKLDGVAGFLVFALVPIAVMVGLILMLRALRPSLPTLAAPRSPATAGGGLLRHVSSVLVPFMVIYSSYGYFAADRNRYFLEILADDLSNGGYFTAPGSVQTLDRLPFKLNAVLVGVVAAALLVRWLVGRSKRLRARTWAGFLLGYCEVLAVTLGVLLASLLTEPVLAWITSRTAAAWAVGHYESLTAAAMDLASGIAPLGFAVGFIGQSLGSADAVIAVPLSWLAVGAVVFGHRMRQPAAANQLTGQAMRRWRLVPTRLRRTTITATAGGRQGIAPLIDGIALLRRIGLRTMLLFCLAFVAVQAVPDWLWELERLIVGPQDLQQLWMGLSGPLSVLNDAVGMTLLICLVAAAVDLVLSVQGQTEAQPAAAEPAAGQPVDASRA